jgi:hypothetical protein
VLDVAYGYLGFKVPKAEAPWADVEPDQQPVRDTTG